MDLSEYITGEWSAPRPTSFNTRDLLAYAVGIGCSEMKFVYESAEDFAAFPLYPVVLASHKGDTQDIDTWASSASMLGKAPRPAAAGQARMPALPGTKVGVAAERTIEILRPLPPGGARLALRNRLLGVHKKGSGALTEQEFELSDADTGDVICRQVMAGFSIGAFPQPLARVAICTTANLPCAQGRTVSQTPGKPAPGTSRCPPAPRTPCSKRPPASPRR